MRYGLRMIPAKVLFVIHLDITSPRMLHYQHKRYVGGSCPFDYRARRGSARCIERRHQTTNNRTIHKPRPSTRANAGDGRSHSDDSNPSFATARLLNFPSSDVLRSSSIWSNRNLYRRRKRPLTGPLRKASMKRMYRHISETRARS